MKNAMSLEALNYAFLRLCVKGITQFPSTNSEAKHVFLYGVYKMSAFGDRLKKPCTYLIRRGFSFDRMPSNAWG